MPDPEPCGKLMGAMDDVRLSNLLFLAGVVSLAVPACDDTVAPRSGQPRPSGNPLERDDGLMGAEGNDEEVCLGFATRMIDCASGYDYRQYELDDYISYCEFALGAAMRTGSRCAEATLDLYACIGEQDCQSFACSTQEDAVDVACRSEDEFGTSG